jgi:Tfp pilus assembly PilM family ATPase
VKRNTVIIELLSGHIEIVVMEGATARARRSVPVALDRDPVGFCRSLRAVGRDLRAAIEALEATGLDTRVLYESPTVGLDLKSCSVRTADQARGVAELSLVEAFSYAIETASVGSWAVGRDAAGTKRAWHVIAAAERDDVANAVADLVEAAGLRLCSLTPIDSLLLCDLIETALTDEQSTRGWLHIGQHGSYFAVASHGVLEFIRRSSLGVHTLVDGLTRHLTIDGETKTLDHTEVAMILAEFGIPEADQVVLPSDGISGRHIRPLLQPMLERFIVELRQSLRFGLSESARSELRIEISGPGADLKGLRELLSGELGIDFEIASHSAETTGASDDIDLATVSRRAPLLDSVNLIPRKLAATQRVARLRSLLWLGAAAAMVMIGVDFAGLRTELDERRKELAVQASRHHEMEAMKAIQLEMATATAAWAQARSAVAANIGSRAHLGPLIKEVTAATDDALRITAMHLSRGDGDSIHLDLTGYVDSTSHPGRLEAFVSSMRAGPLCRDATLRNVQQAIYGTIEGERFEARLELVPLPNGLAMVTAPEDNGGSP